DAGDNFPRFFETGYNFTNTIALTGGSEAQNFRLSFSDLRNTSIVPNTGFDRTTATLATNSKFGERLTITSKIMYSHEFADNRTNLSDSPNNAHLSMYYIPANTNLEWYKGDPNKLGAVPIDQDETSLTIWGVQPGWEMPVGEHLWHQNPYWVAYQFDNDDTRDRIIASGQARYDITDWLWVQGRAQMDWYTRRKHIVGPQGTQHSPQGSVDENESRVREINIDWMAGVDKTFGRVGLNAFIGGQTMRRTREDLNLHGGDFNVPFFEVINFSVNRTWGFGFSESGINSLFGSVALSYNNVLFLTATGRQDWFSVLNPANNSVFYPSVSASFVFSDAFQMPTFLSFGKLRAGWARVGNATIDPYDTNLTYSPIGGAPHVGAPIASFTTAGGQNGLIPNRDLVPLEADELVLGIDLRLLHGNTNLNFMYYGVKTTNEILYATLKQDGGFSSSYVLL